jgi:ubiquinone/menaquinone biosynthesis C-methylase UbiE
MASLNLDVGIGTDLYHLKNWFGLKGEVIGIDIRKDHKPDILCDAHHLPFKNSTFDNVTASEVLEHMIAPVKALNEWRRVLKPGRKLFVTVPNGAWFTTIVQVARRKKNPSLHPEHYSYWNYMELEKILKISGFTVISTQFFTRGLSMGLLPKISFVCRRLVPSLFEANIMVIAKKGVIE